MQPLASHQFETWKPSYTSSLKWFCVIICRNRLSCFGSCSHLVSSMRPRLSILIDLSIYAWDLVRSLGSNNSRLAPVRIDSFKTKWLDRYFNHFSSVDMRYHALSITSNMYAHVYEAIRQLLRCHFSPGATSDHISKSAYWKLIEYKFRHLLSSASQSTPFIRAHVLLAWSRIILQRSQWFLFRIGCNPKSSA